MGLAADNTSPAPGDARRFAAFISYSHADADAAAKLQRKLERYRLPKRIAETRASQTSALGPIFRDREDLAAAASLSAAIRDAIARAEALIVMCSPDAVASPWVAAEIDLFRELHPERPILAALLSGEPDMSFPAALTAGGNEPLAADMRPEGDGEQLAFLKIVAGIAGVPLDTLIQRDAQRRIRRVTAITAGALAAVLIMAIMTTLAIQARNEAARQRAAAEGLVEYMLTDLREKLRGVGRIDIMDAVNERAMAHYRAQGNLTKLPADSLERRARVLHAMGEDYDNRGELAAAQEKFQEAHRTTAALLQQQPGNPDRIFAHAQSEFYSGLAAWRQDDRVTTTRHWQAYLSQAKALATAEPDSSRSMMELGFAEGNLCELAHTDQYDLASAKRSCANAIHYAEAAFDRAPNDRKVLQDIANRYGWQALVELDLKEHAASKRSREKEAAIMDQLLRLDPKNTEYALRRCWADIGLAQLSMAQNPATAETILQQSMRRNKALFAENAGDGRALETLLRIKLLIAKSRRESGKDYKNILQAADQIVAQMKKLSDASGKHGQEIRNRIWS